MKADRKAPDHGPMRELRARLAERYCAPEWYFATEVTLGQRRLDAVAFRLWRGSGLGNLLVAFEIKVTRSDWMRELKEFTKADAALIAVDQFYVVAPSGVVQLDELPRDWGLIEWTGKVLRARAHPPKKLAGAEMTRDLAARLIDRERTAAGRDAIAEREAMRAQVRQEVEERVRRELAGDRVADDAERYRKLMVGAGLGRYADPVEVLRAALAVQKAAALARENIGGWMVREAKKTIRERLRETDEALDELERAERRFDELLGSRDAELDASLVLPGAPAAAAVPGVPTA